MGCMSSKIMRRSLSYQEDLTRSFQKKKKKNAYAKDNHDIAAINGNDDHLLALIRAANKIHHKTRGAGAGGFTSALQPTNAVHQAAISRADDDDADAETINAWELMADLLDGHGSQKQQQQQQEEQQNQSADDPTTIMFMDRAPMLPPPPRELVVDQLDHVGKGSRRSKSCSGEGFGDINEDEWDMQGLGEKKTKGISRCRSFHTVEEYDALLHKIRLEKTEIDKDIEYGSEDTSYCSAAAEHHTSNEVKREEEEEEAVTSESSVILVVEIESKSSSSCTSIADQEESSKTSKSRSIISSEKGLKRKTVGKGLAGSLKIPALIEFQIPNNTPQVQMQMQWLFSPTPAPGGGGTTTNYATPKFGSYHHSNTTNKYSPPAPDQNQNQNQNQNIFVAGDIGRCEESILDPDMVAAFEECMQQLKAEEEKLLKQMQLEPEGRTATVVEIERQQDEEENVILSVCE